MVQLRWRPTCSSPTSSHKLILFELYSVRRWSTVGIQGRHKKGRIEDESGRLAMGVTYSLNIKYFNIHNHMSKQAPKVELEEEKAKVAFENTPKLFSKWSYDDIKIEDPCFIDVKTTITHGAPLILVVHFHSSRITIRTIHQSNARKNPN